MFFNKCIDQGNTPHVSKLASITPVFSKGSIDSVDNLKNFCVSILTLFKKKFISKYKYKYSINGDFIKDSMHNTHFLLGMFKKWKRSVDKMGFW